MKNEIRDQLLSWIRESQTPPVEQVSELRRRCAVDGLEELSRILINLEKNIERSESDPLAPLRKFFREGAGRSRCLKLKMAQNEPFADQRRRVLENMAEERGVECKEIDSKMFEVSTPVSREMALFKGLYNWEVVDEG